MGRASVPRFELKEAAQGGGLSRGDKTLSAPAFRAFVDVMHEARLFFLNTRKPHLPPALHANRLARERSWRNVPLCHVTVSAKALCRFNPPSVSALITMQRRSEEAEIELRDRFSLTV